MFASSTLASALASVVSREAVSAFARGWNPDPPLQVLEDTRSARYTGIGLGGIEVTEIDGGVEQPVRVVRDQRRLRSCSGQALASVIDAARPRARPASAIGIWREGRRLAGALRELCGAHLSYCAQGLVDRGVESARPGEDADEAAALRPASIDAELEAADHRVPGAARARIVEEGADRVDAVEDAIAKGYGVVFGTNITQAFEGFVMLAARGHRRETMVVAQPFLAAPQGDPHAMRIVAVRRRMGRREFRLVNSFAITWAFDGQLWVDEEVIGSPHSDDFNVLRWVGNVGSQASGR